MLEEIELGPGTFSLEFKTETHGGQFAPEHFLAAWVTNENNEFIKTFYYYAQDPNFIQYLEKWTASAAGDKTDATTGATLKIHEKHVINWDCKDLNGVEVPDGKYKVWLEMTEANAKGPHYTITFTKGAAKDSAKMPDITGFKDIYKVFKH
jgi:hypothetical protein